MRLVRSTRHRRLVVASFAALGALAAAGGVAGGALTEKSKSVTLDPVAVQPATAKCKTRAVAGGFEGVFVAPEHSGSFVQTFASQRASSREWTSTAINYGDQAGDLVTYVYCSKQLPKLTQKTATTSIEPYETGTATTRCKPGGEAVSGGFIADGSAIDSGKVVFPFDSMRQGTREWVATGYNADDVAAELTAFAYCARHKLGLRTASAESSTSEDTAALSATATCKENERVVSGGFAGNVSNAEMTFVEPTESRRVGKREWRASTGGFSEGDAVLNWEAFAYCLEQ